jgi:hypothetical protein
MKISYFKFERPVFVSVPDPLIDVDERFHILMVDVEEFRVEFSVLDLAVFLGMGPTSAW